MIATGNRHVSGAASDISRFTPRHDSFVGVDSDGCVFDTMEAKQKRCFHGEIVRRWRLEPIEGLVRETAEFVNLYSRWRGSNRFPALLRTFDLLRARPETARAGVALPRLDALRAFVGSGVPLGNPELERAVRETGDAELAQVLDWSRAVNDIVARTLGPAAPFPWAVESLKAMQARSDVICVSQTPTEALVREWRESGLLPCVAVIAGQEQGTKSEHLALATRGRYRPGRLLMIGDALGDLRAARDSGALFYPINPAREAASWKRFLDEAYDRFLAGAYAGAYESGLISEFETLLPETPPWTT